MEAARAGEAGAGFAVVADEVRNLAMRAADAARSTAELIQETAERIHSGSRLVSEIHEAFTRVSDSSGKVGDLVMEIAAASQEQSRNVDEANKAVAGMDKVTQQNAAHSESASSASAQLQEQAGRMMRIVADMVALVGGEKCGGKNAGRRAEGAETSGGERKRRAIGGRARKMPPEK